MMANGGEDYTWTTVGELGLFHVRKIGSGSFGEVHELDKVRMSTTSKVDCLGSRRTSCQKTHTTFRWPHD
jgi:hypothetical protein